MLLHSRGSGGCPPFSPLLSFFLLQKVREGSIYMIKCNVERESAEDDVQTMRRSRAQEPNAANGDRIPRRLVM